MRNIPKNKLLIAVLISVAVVAFFLIIRAGGGSGYSGVRIGYTSREGSSSWSASYRSLDGKMWKYIHPEGGMLHIRVETKSGTVSVRVEDKEGNVIFEEQDIGAETGTEAFDVEVTGRGEVRIEAAQHSGSFDISSEP